MIHLMDNTTTTTTKYRTKHIQRAMEKLQKKIVQNVNDALYFIMMYALAIAFISSLMEEKNVQDVRYKSHK